ncbi:LuxR C-terminal-related transcriptional regulator [Isachenkonia alkalipeptolytica]|uniref:Helix-turn-helix transcriptional regulator n=1 Tax=Isachenkonia alkalipeptolytica TaxID=2565777 RepID=A0AA44BE03_9CLOT|nr:LuxR family transcriptional regulator [Isachenkonia alkalipeptolytica]NBG88859.1 helix-turn-helix transcriptional regulator [Isachenkonia alkalipeptolytica]
MRQEKVNNMDFFSEMSEHQISSSEFFSYVLLDSLGRNFGLTNVVIAYFDTNGEFLSWINSEGLLVDGKEHPYRSYFKNDQIRDKIYKEAVSDDLTYFNVNPRLYKSTDLIEPGNYDQSPYVAFIEENFQAHYSMSLAFGINAYIQVVFLKSSEEGDFTDQEADLLEKIYVYIANSYKNFKKHEQAKIVLNIQNEIIASGEKAYLITDKFMNVMSYNENAIECLKEVYGPWVVEQIKSTKSCTWLPFLLGDEDDKLGKEGVQIREIKGYIFRIYIHDQGYSNGIIDRYRWITISGKTKEKLKRNPKKIRILTPAEQRVAELMYDGLTYKAIAEELVVSYHTVKKHVQNIYTKCGVNSRFELYKLLEDKKE